MLSEKSQNKLKFKIVVSVFINKFLCELYNSVTKSHRKKLMTDV